MILTGRPVQAEEALAMGLANRVVDDGSAVDSARALARELAAFPQRCLLADRTSALRQWDLDLHGALVAEGAAGYPVVFEESIEGAKKFKDGAGRHGRF
ncbi:MAG: enoyl-CoA hydratase, partial [Marinobacter sp.]|nr:enoyl-CoA hydratase [Marinobacter sp.]